MSGKKHVDAKLKGYSYPIFPRKIGSLNRALDRSPEMMAMDFEGIAKSISGYAGSGLPCTSDGYKWYLSLRFKLPGGKRVLFALPCARDFDQLDGLRLDRSAAVYTYGNVSTQLVDWLTDLLVGKIQLFPKSML